MYKHREMCAFLSYSFGVLQVGPFDAFQRLSQHGRRWWLRSMTDGTCRLSIANGVYFYEVEGRSWDGWSLKPDRFAVFHSWFFFATYLLARYLYYAKG